MKHRERLEKQQEARLAAELRHQAQRQAALDQRRNDRDALFAAGLDGGELDPALLGATSAYIVRLGRDIAAREAALDHSRGLVGREREALLARRRDRKAMETLLDARLAAERQARSRAELRRLDEAATVRWNLPAD